MTEGQLHKLSNLCHLLAASTNIIVSHIRQVSLFVFSLDGIALCESYCQVSELYFRFKIHTSVDHCILGHYTELRWIGLNNFELHCSHATADQESVAFANGTVCWKDSQ